jgi:hypothetical protein
MVKLPLVTADVVLARKLSGGTQQIILLNETGSL